MADGQYRFQPAPGQQFYAQYNNNTRHLQQRPTSPPTTSRRIFARDTPSPNRSPRARSPSNLNLNYSMYSQNHAAINAHGMLNGSNHQRFGNQLVSNKAVGHHNPYQNNHHGQHNAGAHAEHQGFISHQHNQSGGAPGHFGGTHMQNGTPNNTYSTTNKTQSEHWAKQQEIAAEIRSLTFAHPHARNASTASKSVMPGNSNGAYKEAEQEGHGYRTQGDWSDEEAEESIWTEIDFAGQNLRCVSVQLFDYYPFLTKLYLNNNRLERIPPEVGQLRNLTHADFSLNQISTLPPEMSMLVNMKSLLLVDNKIEVIPYELGTLFQLEMLAIDGNPLNEQQHTVIVEQGCQALIRELREEDPGPPTPNERDWIVVDDATVSPDDLFTVASFNILCKQAATPTQFGYTPLRWLSWDTRKQMILDEIRSRDADFVCLQEMDSDNYNNLFREELARLGYKGVYWPRGRSKTMSEHQLKQVDGCAIFFKGDKFILLDKQLIEYATVIIRRPDMAGQSDAFNRVMPRDNIGVVTFLENRLTGARLMVTNTHLFWDQTFRDVKVIQAATFLDETRKCAEKYAKWPPTPDKDKVLFRFANGDKPEGEEPTEEVVREPVPSMSYEKGTDIPLIVCGDFNSTVRSGVYELITTGQLPGNHKDLGTFKYGDMSKHGMRHPFNLKSSYSAIGELPFTNYTPGFTGVLDYIFHSSGNLQVTKLLGEVDREYLKRVPGFPNQHYPSDHLLLWAEFKVKSKKERKITEVDFGPSQSSQKERR